MIEQDATTDEAADVMRERAVRRLLVCDDDRQLVGHRLAGRPGHGDADPTSALSDISEAAPNN